MTEHPPLAAGYYVATQVGHRPQIVEYVVPVVHVPHWRNHLDHRLAFDPRDLGYILRPLATAWFEAET